MSYTRPYDGPEILSKIDATRISDGLNCEAYFYLRHIKGFVPDGGSLALVYGSAIHAALAEHYRGKGFKATCRAFDEVWLAEAQGRSDQKRSPRRALAILQAYMERYKQEYFEVLAVEVPFLIPVKHLKFMGVIDLVVKMGESQRLAIIDHKTTSVLSPYYWLQYRTNADIQGPGYLTAINKLVAKCETWVPSAILVDATKTAFERQYFTPDISYFTERLLHWHQRMLSNYY